MNVSVILTDLSTDIKDIVSIDNIENKDSFEYIDNDSSSCQMFVYENGIYFIRKCEDHILELDLKDNNCAKITSSEGIIKIDAKVVDFSKNNGILVMRYIIEGQEREIKIIYRS